MVPDSFKYALVKPLLKSSSLDQNQLKNYRPVSNLQFLSKILEKVVLSQLTEHLEKNKLTEPLQSAYRKHHSTETALLKVMNDVYTNTDDNEVTMLCLLDLSAAFDTIDHDILIRRLEAVFGIQGIALNWFRSYLTRRHQAVVVDGVKSSNTPLNFGVPQGSVLGPVLFTLYMQPLSQIISDFNINYHFYADDSQLYKSANVNDIPNLLPIFEQCVQAIKNWMNLNRLKLNEDKTEIILLGNKNQLINVRNKKIVINDCIISFSVKVKNLGVLIDSNLSMRDHVNNIIKKSYLEIKRIKNVRQFLNENTTALLVNSLVLSKIDYCNALLVNMSIEQLKRLQRVQNNAARLVLKRNKFCSSKPLLIQLHWLPVESRIKYKICTTVFKILNSQAPQYLSDLVKNYCPARCLRSSNDPNLLVKHKTSRKIGERSFQYAAPHFWNSLPKTIRQIDSLSGFKSQLKTYLFTR